MISTLNLYVREQYRHIISTFKEFTAHLGEVRESKVTMRHIDRQLQDCHRAAFSQSSVAQLCRIPCDPMDSITPGFPVRHRFTELTKIHVHLVSDAIQPSHPLSSPSPPAFNLPQHQGLF